MVILLYILILVPLGLYIVLFGTETILSIRRAASGNLTKGELYIHSTWEITHTLLVYAFTIFMVSFADLLPATASIIFGPLALFMIALMGRGVLYLYLAYSDTGPGRVKQAYQYLLALTHIINLATIVWVIVALALQIQARGFTPSTDIVLAGSIGLVITLAIVIWPMIVLYRRVR